MTDMIARMSRAMFRRMESPQAREIHKDLLRKSLTPLLNLPDDLIVAGINAVHEGGRNISRECFVGPKDVTVPFYAVIRAILGDEENGN